MVEDAHSKLKGSLQKVERLNSDLEAVTAKDHYRTEKVRTKLEEAAKNIIKVEISLREAIRTRNVPQKTSIRTGGSQEDEQTAANRPARGHQDPEKNALR